MTNQSVARKVAKIYTAAAIEGKPPAKTVRDVLGLPPSTAGYWIRRAKDLGLIEGPLRRNARAVKVARALNVEYDDLVQAVNRHAAGRLVLR